MGRGGLATRPAVTLTLIGICVAAYVAQQSIAGFTRNFLYAPFLTESQPWRMVTSAFLHDPGSVLHIVFNMYALWLMGPYLERLFGWARFLSVYLICAFGGSVGYLVLLTPQNDGWFGGAYGASGAVFGLFAAYLVVQRKLGRDATPIMVIIGLNFAIGFLPGLNIAWQAHLGGLITGLAAAGVLAYAPRDRRTLVQVGGLVGLTLLLVLITVIKINSVDPSAFGSLSLG